MLQDTATTAVLPAMEANFFQFFANFARLPNAELNATPDLTCLLTDTPLAILNGVLRTQLTPDGIDEKIDGVLEHFRQRMTPMMWHTGPSTQPADLGRCLERHGLILVEDLLWMAADLHVLNENLPAPPGLTIHRVNDAETLTQWARTLCFGAPESVISRVVGIFDHLGVGTDRSDFPLYHNFGVLDGELVATSSLFLAAGVASLQFVSTIPPRRRQGIGTAFSLLDLREARKLGYRIGVLSSSQMAVNVYRKVGFHVLGNFGVYRWQPA